MSPNKSSKNYLEKAAKRLAEAGEPADKVQSSYSVIIVNGKSRLAKGMHPTTKANAKKLWVNGKLKDSR